MRSFLVLCCILFSIHSLSTETRSIFRGIVQYVDGDFTLIPKEGVTKKLEYKDVIGSDYRIKTETGLHTKIRTINRCIIVLHDGILQTSVDLWQINGTTRIICDSVEKEGFQWKGQNFTLVGGEILLHQNKLYLLKGSLMYDGKLYSRGNYEWSENQFREASQQPTARERYEINNQFGVPTESVYYGKSAPDRHATSRWQLAGSPLGITSLFHETEKYSFHNSQTHMVRLSASFPYKRGGLGVSLGFSDSKMGRDEGPQQYDPSKGHLNLRTEAFHIESTYRFSWTSSFSPYVSFGILENKFHVTDQGPSSGSYNKNIDAIVTSYGTNLSIGIEKIFFYNSWIALFTQVEVSYLRTWITSQVEPRSDYSQGPFPKAGEDRPFNQIIGRIFIGPIIQFF